MGRGVPFPLGMGSGEEKIFGLFILNKRYLVHSEVYFKLYIPIFAIAPTAPHASATARNRGNVQVIVRKDHNVMMRLSFLREQLVRSSEQLVLVDTKRGF